MKNSKIFLILAFLTAGLLVGQKAQAQRGGAVSFQYFHNELSPYGNWASHPKYGSVWTPYDVSRNFQPYGTDGRWVMTEFGNTWVSDLPWGWATFHYGRWFYDDYLGWAWVPGYEWGPAWVDWRSNNNYYGWAPMWPGVQIGVSFNIPLNYWVFVPQRYIYRRSVFGYCVPRYRYNSFFGRTTVINNYYYNDNRSYAYGPSRGEVERVTRGNVPTYRAEDVRNNRIADNNGSGTSNRTYQADDYSRSGLDRQSRDNGGSTNGRTSDAGTTSGRSSRSYGTDNSGSSNGRSSNESTAPSSGGRTYDATKPSSRSRSSDSRSGNAYEVPGNRSATPSYDSNESRSRSNSSTPSYDSGSRSRSSSPSVSNPGYESRSRSSVPSGPEMRSAPSRSSSSDYNSSRSRSSSEYSAPSRGSSTYSAPSRSSAPAMSSPPSRSSAPSVSSPAPSRSSSPSSSSPASSTPSRSRGPR